MLARLLRCRDLLEDVDCRPVKSNGSGSRDSPQHTFTHVGVPDVPLWVLVVKRFALLAAAAHGVVLTIVAHSPADVSGGQENRHVEVAGGGVFVAVALCEREETMERGLAHLLAEGGRDEGAHSGQEGPRSGKRATNQQALMVRKATALRTLVSTPNQAGNLNGVNSTK